jgi:hypothetical protein
MPIFEGWVSGPSIKKVDKGLRQIQYGLLQALRIANFQPFMLFFPYRKLLFHGESGNTFARVLVSLGHGNKRLIPDPANATKGLR